MSELVNNVDVYNDLDKVIEYLKAIRTSNPKETKRAGYMMSIAIKARVLLKP